MQAADPLLFEPIIHDGPAALRECMRAHAVDAMEWILACCIDEAAFDRDKDRRAQAVCRYYLEVHREEDGWDDDEAAAMMVLVKYEEIKGRGYGSFAKERQAARDLK